MKKKKLDKITQKKKKKSKEGPKSRLEREKLIRQVEELSLWAGLPDEEVAKRLKINRKTVSTYAKKVLEKFNKKLADKGALVKETVMADKRARDDSYNMWVNTKDRRWLLTYLTANEKFADKLLKFGVVDAVKQEFTGEVVFKWQDDSGGDSVQTSRETETVSQE